MVEFIFIMILKTFDLKIKALWLHLDVAAPIHRHYFKIKMYYLYLPTI